MTGIVSVTVHWMDGESKIWSYPDSVIFADTDRVIHIAYTDRTNGERHQDAIPAVNVRSVEVRKA